MGEKRKLSDLEASMRNPVIMVDDDTIMNVATGDRYRVSGMAEPGDGSPSTEPFADVLARHDFGINDSGKVVAGAGGVSVELDATDASKAGDAVLVFKGRANRLTIGIHGGLGIVSDKCSVSSVPMRVTFVSLGNESAEMTVEGNVVSVPGLSAPMPGPDGEDYAAELVDVLERLCASLDDGDERLCAIVAPFVCGIQSRVAVVPVDWIAELGGAE